MCIDVCMCCVDVHVSVYMYFTNTYSNMYTQRHTHAHTHATHLNDRYFDEKRGKEALEALKGQASATTGLAQLQVCMSVCICTYVCMYMYIHTSTRT